MWGPLPGKEINRTIFGILSIMLLLSASLAVAIMHDLSIAEYNQALEQWELDRIDNITQILCVNTCYYKVLTINDKSEVNIVDVVLADPKAIKFIIADTSSNWAELKGSEYNRNRVTVWLKSKDQIAMAPESSDQSGSLLPLLPLIFALGI